MKVLAALSGGVDSAVAAARARDAGHEVTGVHLALAGPATSGAGPRGTARARGCCSPADARDARRVADVLDIPFYVWDFAERFREDVVEDFLAEYAAGRTPNPCLRCNERIKFAAVADRASALGFDAVCTGHYARLVTSADGVALHRAVDPAKDQSYVLGVLTGEQLTRCLFPLGESRKLEVRAEARERGLLVAGKPDSHDVCFIPDGDTDGWLRARLGTAPGPVVDRGGRVLGTHQGAYAFTVGQRRGLRLGVPDPDGGPRYVLQVSPATATVTVGSAGDLEVVALDADHLRWAGPAPAGPVECLAQVRAHGEAVAARAEPVAGGPTYPGRLRVVLHRTLRGVAPGQAVVLYDADRVVGSATIVSTAGQ
ncbi:MAG: tRNA 2-thiouridine(34) synthase MnmA [Actinomycetes bacterium]